MTPTPKNDPHILFLFSDTGGGHRSAAEAIIEAIRLEYGERVSTEMVDIFLQYAPPPINLAPRIYPPLSRMPELWELGYRISDGKQRTRFAYTMLWPYVRRSVDRLLAEHPASLVVSVHPLINTPVSRAARKLGVPFTTVVTDLVSTHAAWYCPQAQAVIVPTEEALRRGLAMGLPQEIMRVAGLPVADRFCQPIGDRGALRDQLGWQRDLPVVVLIGGGEGMGPLAATAQAIDAARLPVQLVVVTGRNRALRERLETYPWHVDAKIYGFVTQMPDFMRAADVLITKAGPGTISEAFIAGLPLILYSKMPGQEDGNVHYVVNQGAGVWAPDPDRVVDTLRAWLENPRQREKIAATALSLARPDAARQIARLLLQAARAEALI
ncbi:MAG: glycosyltransferase [Chloroflexota bacterium]|jgi:1,2-diacylglycerol 3-beta-galactosyltransferase